jgi:hypothetical protein
VQTGRTQWVKQLPLGGGGTHGAQWRDGKLWIIASRLNSMLRVDAESWICDYAIRIRNDTPDTMRSHDMIFDDQGFIWLATANTSRNYAEGIQSISNAIRNRRGAGACARRPSPIASKPCSTWPLAPAVVTTRNSACCRKVARCLVTLLPYWPFRVSVN